LVKEENEMIDFELTEEQLMLQRVCHDFAENEIRSRAWELEKNTDPGKCYDFDLVKKASQLGLRTTTIPEELGGSGLDLKTIVIMWEELAWGDMGFAFSLYHTIFFGRGISHMPESLREELLPPFLKDDTFLLAYALSEPQGMTEVVLPYDGPDGGFKIFAEKQGDEYVVSGTKQYCSNAINAKIIVLNARTKKNAPLRESWSSFFMPVDTPGLTIGKPHDHMGARLLPTSELFLEDVRIPARYLIGGEENKGFEQNLVHDPVVLVF
jgi:alkylation response protein AidB-like acyl-CoA dehydrogenase